MSEWYVYAFYWDDGNRLGENVFLMKIKADKETVQRLLDEYRDEDKGYDQFGWLEFLKKHGIEAELIEPEHWIYF